MAESSTSASTSSPSAALPLSLRSILPIVSSNYSIPQIMLDQGFTMLERVVDLQRSKSSRLVLFGNNASHVIMDEQRCHNMVYVLIKWLGSVHDNNEERIIYFENSTLLYAGQTANFHQREAARRHSTMENSQMKICLGHSLTKYQMDCFEATLIVFLFVQYGMRTQNRTVYPTLIYRSISSSTSIDLPATHPSPTSGVNTWGLVRRAIIIGTAPPMRLLSNSDYQVTLTDWINRLTNGEVVSNPIIDWAGETGRSRSLRSLRDFLQSENGDMPPFFNHYPTKESDNYRGLFNDTTIEEIREADANVRSSISFHSRDIVVMFGARPTLLYPNPQRRNYLASVCPYVDLYWLQKDICGFVVWWPDTGLLNHTHMACQALLNKIWQLATHKLHVLVFRLNEVAANTVGVEPKEAYNILNWLKEHPTSLQLDELLKELAIMWTKKESVATARTGIVTQFQYMMPDIQVPVESLPDVPDLCLVSQSITKAALPSLSLAEVTKTWSVGSVVRLTNKAHETIPNFQAMDEKYQALEMYRLGKKERDNLMGFWMKNYIDSGLFIPFPHESNEEQWVRWWRQINMEKMLRSNDSRSIWLTCCWCGQLTKKVLQQGKVNLGTVKDRCPNKMSHSVGWSVVQGKHDDIFPDSNLFLLFFESLPSSIVINHWQLSVDFVDFLGENQWHVQAKVLHDKYKEIFPSIRRFTSDTATKGLSTSLIQGLTNAMEKLGKLNPPKDVKIFKRNTRKEEKRGKKNTGKTKTLFAIRVAVENTETLMDLEDFSYRDYGKTFGISRKPIWPGYYRVDQSTIASTSRHNVSNE